MGLSLVVPARGLDRSESGEYVGAVLGSVAPALEGRLSGVE